VPSRLSEHPSSVIGALPRGTTIMDSLDFELNLLGTNHPRTGEVPHRMHTQPYHESQVAASRIQLTNSSTQPSKTYVPMYEY
jgi:hypothetical protein